MRLTQTLLGYLNRVFAKDGDPFLALRLDYPSKGVMTWKVDNARLTTTVDGGTQQNLQVQSGAPMSVVYSLGVNTIDLGAVTAPEGTNTARRLRSGPSGPGHVYISRATLLPVSPSTAYTASLFVRLNAGTLATAFGVVIDEFDASMTFIARTGSASLAGLTGTYTRRSRTFNTLSNTRFMMIYWAADWTVGAELDVWGFQVNPGATMDEFLPTGSTAVVLQPIELGVDLTAYTIAGLVSYLAGQRGYSTPYMDPTSLAQLSARALVDGTGSPSLSNGDHVYAYADLAYAYAEALSVELQAAQVQVGEMLKQMVVPTASGEWLDLLGSYYAVPRRALETDASYAPRIVTEALRPRSNNVAIESALRAYTGSAATVTDQFIWGPIAPVYNSLYTHNAAIYYNTAATKRYGLFDVTCTYNATLGTLPAFTATVRAIVERMRAGGTQMRTLTVL